MAATQREAIGRAIAQVMEAEPGSTLCCTIATRNKDGQEVSIQVMQDSLNIAPYMFDENPAACLAKCGALEGLEGFVLEAMDWDAGTFGIVTFRGIPAEGIARLVDHTFVRLLACDDASYAVSTSTKDIG